MKQLLMIFFVSYSLTANCQLGWEDFYSEQDFRTILRNARSSKERIYALGLLGNKRPSDSIMREIYAIVDTSDDNELRASALWWNAIFNQNDTMGIIKLLKFADQTQLTPFRIAARLLFADYFLHDDLQRSLYYAKSADSLLSRISKDKDSLRIEVCRRIAHAYVHKGESVNVARYLLPIRNYAERAEDEHIRMQAVEVLADIYAEGDRRRGIPWHKILHAYFKNRNLAQKYAGQTYNLAVNYSQLYVRDSLPDYKAQAIHYFNELDKLIDSLQVYNWFIYWVLNGKFDIGLLTAEDLINLVDNNYNSHYHFSASQSRNLKLKVYYATGQFDSLKAYIQKIPKSEYYDIWLKDYYLKKGDFVKAIKTLHPLRKYYESQHSKSRLQSVYNDLVKAYAGEGNYKLAYEYKLKSLRIKDTLDKLESKEEIAALEMQNEMELQRATFDDEQAKTSLKNRMRLYVFIAGSIVLFIVALILWVGNQRKQKDKLRLQEAYNYLKSTQQQLIQSEKMASLGELTAGIAHEIQNPLNFVNNFSDLNKELLFELNEEIKKGNYNTAQVLANDLIDNENKVSHHGKRAEAIVKGMLQHSRTGSAQKEPTDINDLADEYLRLAYHGLRAKEKSFNAKIETDFDSSIEKINVVPQDIGRVLLNLINNAFYAVGEKQKQNIHGYEPKIKLITKKAGNKIEITVTDNGIGISQKILGKIFQPFFTTKPTGQGTGLGLSLSYDIVKAHGGEVQLKSKEGEGSEFIIQLPVV